MIVWLDALLRLLAELSLIDTDRVSRTWIVDGVLFFR